MDGSVTFEEFITIGFGGFGPPEPRKSGEELKDWIGRDVFSSRNRLEQDFFLKFPLFFGAGGGGNRSHLVFSGGINSSTQFRRDLCIQFFRMFFSKVR